LKNSFTRFFLRNPSNYIFWILIALIIKGLIPFILLFHGHRTDPHLLSFGFIGDGPSYTDPIESFLANGHYYPDRRMPGYGIIYLILRLIFSYNSTYNTIIIIQLIVSSLSVYCLALLSRMVLKSNLAFYLAFYFFLISSYSNYYDICLGTESLCSAFLIFGTWYFALYFQKEKLRLLFFSGFFLTWAAFLRPVFVVILLIYGIVFLFYSIKSKNNFVKPLFIYSLAFILFDGAWIVRNYNVHHQFIPLARGGFYYPYVEDSYMSHELEFVQSWGGAVQLPDGHSALSWFGGILFPGEKEIKEYDSIPDYIYTSKFNKDSLYALRGRVKKFMALQKPAVDSFYNSTNKDWFKAFAILYEPLKPVSPAAAALQNDIDNTFDTYKASIKSEKPFLYYVKAPLVLLRKFLFEGNADYFKRGQIPGLGKVMFSFYHYYYLVLLFFGGIGIVLLTWKGIRSDFMLLLLPIIPGYTIIIHPLLRAAYNRFLLPAWPFIILCAVYVATLIIKRISKAESSNQAN
jgi:hypothetical protein